MFDSSIITLDRECVDGSDNDSWCEWEQVDWSENDVRGEVGCNVGCDVL